MRERRVGGTRAGIESFKLTWLLVEVLLTQSFQGGVAVRNPAPRQCQEFAIQYLISPRSGAICTYTTTHQQPTYFVHKHCSTILGYQR